MIGSRRVICLVVDALSASYLGPYGNTWIRTPAFNRLAAESLVLDRMLIETSSCDDAYVSMWTGAPPWFARSDSEPRALATQCQDAKIPTAILSDEPDLLAHPLVRTFDQSAHFPSTPRSKPVMEWEETALAEFFAASLSWLEDHPQHGLLWLHTGALGRVWDAPIELREAYTDEEDPPPAEIVVPPSGVIFGDANPDELLALRHAYAGQVTVLDHCLRAFFETIDKSPWANSLLFVLLGLRGYPLGEHGTVGLSNSPLLGELTHAPCFVRTPAGSGGNQSGVRSSALAQPRDLHATICEWLNVTDLTQPLRTGIEGSAHDERPQPAPSQAITTPLSPAFSLLRLLETSHEWPRLLSMTQAQSGEVALVTPAWYFHWSPLDPNQTPVARIFAKPDDYFEANEVSARCQDEVAEYQNILSQIQDGGALDLINIALSDRLVYGADTMSAIDPGNS